jgi:hypothetical protein
MLGDLLVISGGPEWTYFEPRVSEGPTSILPGEIKGVSDRSWFETVRPFRPALGRPRCTLVHLCTLNPVDDAGVVIEDGRLLSLHPDLLRDTSRRKVIRMDGRFYPA